MQIINQFRARILHSSRTAFSLAMENNKYISFAEKIISAKNEDAHCALINTHSSAKKEKLINSKILKYERFLDKISLIKPRPPRHDELSGCSSYLPRLTVIKRNGNDHEYFLPYKNQPKIMMITTMNESLV